MTCTTCQYQGPRDDFSLYTADTCWRCCTAPCIRIPSAFTPRVQGYKRNDYHAGKRARGRRLKVTGIMR